MPSEAKASGDAHKDAQRAQSERAQSTQSKEEAESPFEDASAEAAESPDARPDDGSEDVELLKSSIEEAQREIASHKDRALRAAAEAENVRRRADRSIENARKFALEKFVENLLPAVDSFERAVEAASSHAAGEESGAGAMAEGLELSLKLLLGAMERQGIVVVDPAGTPFDPNLHEAMTMVDNAEVEPGSVVSVFQKGYTVNGRLIRPARVIVSRPPSAPSPAEEREGPAPRRKEPAADARNSEPEADAT